MERYINESEADFQVRKAEEEMEEGISKAESQREREYECSGCENRHNCSGDCSWTPPLKVDEDY